MKGYTRTTKVASDLGIFVGLLNGLIDGKQIAGVRQDGKSGKHVWFIRDDEIARLTSMVRAA